MSGEYDPHTDHLMRNIIIAISVFIVLTMAAAAVGAVCAHENKPTSMPKLEEHK